MSFNESKNGTPTALDKVVEQLCRPESYDNVYHKSLNDQPMPSVEDLELVVEKLKSVIFPGFFGNPEITPSSMPYHMGATLEGVFRLLSEQIKRGHCFFCQKQDSADCGICEGRAREITTEFLQSLPELRRMLSTDVIGAYEGDPAAKSPGETIFCYPSIVAMTHYRIAHRLFELGVEMIPRIICENAHSKTGIDIHPGASIGEKLFIDHGTGTVIGETCIIGRNVRIYQGVTLGAKSFPKDEETGALIKGIPRHPIVEDNVIIYSGATVLGRVTIGKDAVIGGNVWITDDVPAGSRILQR